MRLLTAIYMYILFVFCENSLPSPRDLKQSAPSLYLASQRSWPQGAEEKLEEKAHFWDNQTKHLLGLRFPLQHHARPDFSCERTSWKNEQDIKKKWKRERKKNPLIHAVSIWQASRQKTHASEFGWQEGVQDEHHWLWTRVEIKHL